MRKILGQDDVLEKRLSFTRKPARELIFYGSIRKGFEDAIQGLTAVSEACQEFKQSDPENVRLDRYCQKLAAMAEALHRLYVKANRVKVSAGE